jgi:hypothetical protein
MKLGVSYNLFDGEELLEYSIKSIRNNTDFISVIYQEISYHGMKCSNGIFEFLLNLKDAGLVDEIVLFQPDIVDTSGENASLNETKKRNLGLEISKNNGCTHHMSMDVDEFYTENQFTYMKSVMENGDFHCAAVKHCQYYKDSIYILKNKEEEYVTTIEKITPDTKYVYMAKYPVPVDPTRKTNNKKCRVFGRNEVEMHHMSFVRRDIKKKLSNSASRRHFTDELINRVDEYYKNWTFPKPAMWAGGNLLEVVEVPRLFEIYK